MMTTTASDRLRWTIRFESRNDLELTRALLTTTARLTGTNASALLREAVVKLLTERYGAVFTKHLIEAHQIAASAEACES